MADRQISRRAIFGEALERGERWTTGVVRDQPDYAPNSVLVALESFGYANTFVPRSIFEAAGVEVVPKTQFEATYDHSMHVTAVSPLAATGGE